jgi:uncharacterized protein
MHLTYADWIDASKPNSMTFADLFFNAMRMSGSRAGHAFFAFCLTLSVPLQTRAQDGPQLDLQRIKLSAGMNLIDAQVAVTPSQRQIGLMMRKEMPQHEGMLFVFEQPAQQCFWMKNTLLPLTAAFVDDDGTIVNLADMEPQTLESHCSVRPVRYVLEMNRGWFAKKNIKSGSRLSGEIFVRR